MSGLKSLLKYRFQPRETEKLDVTPAKSNGNTSPVKSGSDVASVPETPPSKLQTPESPVFSKGSKRNLLESSSSEGSTKSSSPWLSKANGIKNNGCTPSKTGRNQQVKRKHEPDSPASSSQGSQGDDRSQELKMKVDSLKAMFPGCALWMLEDAAVATSDLEAAIDLIIAKNRVGNASRSRPRPALSTQDSQASSSSDIQPPAKRARQLSSESSDLGNSQNSDGTTSPVLQKMPPASSPGNMGSIKAFQAARQASRIRRELMHTDDEEEEEQQQPKTSSIQHRVKKASQPKVTQVDDDDDDDIELIDSDDSNEEEEKDADPILEFFQNAALEELMTMPGCSKKKAEVIVENRPFTDWNNLVYKLDNSKQLNFNLISGCKELLRIRSTVNRLMKHCEQISQDMESIVSALTSSNEIVEDSRTSYITHQPDNLTENLALKPYQLVGLNWLTLMHRQELNGILADEMGLGKTIQTVAFLAQLLQDGEKGPHIIIAPSSTIDNWLRELQVWCPALKVILYYGSQEERRDLRAELLEGTAGEFNVLVSSYNMATGAVEDRALLKKFRFHYAIFDEGHMLKNMSSIRYQNLMKIRAQRRLLLTGTPLQNNLVELLSLLCFVMPEMFVGKTDHLKRMFTAITSGTKSVSDKRGTYETECIERAKQIMKPFFLRRIKAEVLQQMPKKIDVHQQLPLPPKQRELYDDLRTSFTRRLEQGLEGADLGARGVRMLMDLRKAANHHLLHRRHYTDAQLRKMAPLILKDPAYSNSELQYVLEDMQIMSDFELHNLCKQSKTISSFKLDDSEVTDSGKFRFLDDLLPKLKEKGSRVLLFSQFTMMLDIVETYMTERGHSYLRLDGSTPVVERMELIDRFNGEPDIFVFLLSTKAGGLGINLTAADTVILHDIDFNPYNDKQAEDRCHRLGQTKDVTIHRLISKNTVEEAMHRCAQQKLQLEEDITGTGSKTKENSDNDMASLLKQALDIEAIE